MHSFTPKNRQKFAGSKPSMPSMAEEMAESPADEMVESTEMQAAELEAGTEMHDPSGSVEMEQVKKMIGSLPPDQLQMLNEYTTQLLAANNDAEGLDLDKMMNDDVETSAAEDESATVNGQTL